MHPTNVSHSSKTSSTPVASSLRPRTRRLISGLDDELDPTSANDDQASYQSPSLLSPFGSRTASPIPSTHPSRSNSKQPPLNGRAISGQTLRFNQESSAASLSGIWGNSWSAIQGLASNVLGSDTSPKDKKTRRRRPLEATHRRTSSIPPLKQWGPAGISNQNIGAGSQEERENLVRAMKRKDLLAANDQIYSDTVGRIKRRTSDERLSASAPPTEHDDRDALVYIHKVRKEDTFAGISIRFNCEQAVIRKANRMWPNDSVQYRKTIMLPVDACGVKGRPVPDPNSRADDDLLLGNFGESTNDNGTNSAQNAATQNGWTTSHGAHNPRPLSSTNEPDQPWRHDSWVLLPNDTVPTEIGRLPRRALGFFPPARRKSVAYSDASTPSASLDLPRSSTSTNYTNSVNRSPSQTITSTSSPRLTATNPRPNRQRSTSNSSFALHGPGGVGTFGRNVRCPGPAQDGLNKLFASHLPNVAPPPGQDYFTPWASTLLELNNGSDIPPSHVLSQRAMGAASVSPGGGLDLENVGGAIEGWMRKMATRASTMMEQSSNSGGKRSAVPVIGAVGGDLGDLIELRDDAFEIGGGDEDELGRGRSGPETILDRQQYGTARPDTSLNVRERGRKGGGTKTD